MNNFFQISDVGSTASSSGRRSAPFSNVYGERYSRQGSVIASEKASVASGSLVGSGLGVTEGTDSTHLTPQQLGVMGEFKFFKFLNVTIYVNETNLIIIIIVYVL